MKGIAIAATCLSLLAGCVIPTISTDFDPKSRRVSAKTGTHIRGSSDLPRLRAETV